MGIAILIILGFLAVFNLFIYLLKEKIEVLEKRIKSKFVSRTNIVPAIFEISKTYISRHSDIFKEILHLRKVEFSEHEGAKNLSEMIITEGLIHHELNFIFKVCNSHPKLLREWKFIYLREVIVQRSIELGKDIDLYRRIIKQYNSLVKVNQVFVIGFFTPLRSKSEI